MQRTILLGAAGLILVSVGVTHQTTLEGRVASMEEAARRSRGASAAEASVTELESKLETMARALEASAADATELGALRGEIRSLERSLDEARAALGAQGEALAQVQGLAAEIERIDEVEAGVNVRWNGLVQTLEATTSLALETRDELGRVQTSILTDSGAPGRGEPWRAMVGPTVQLAGDATVGSGVLLESRPIDGPNEGPNEGDFRTLLLTSWHVVRDIRADSPKADAPIPVIVRDMEGNKRTLTATLVGHDVALDAALLCLDSKDRFEVGAQLPTRERLRQIAVFHPVVAVGCPLGNDPIPTRGHLSDRHHQVGGEPYWMISAPTYIGNSGGGIYSEESHELLGIFSKIYTHGAIRPTVIPHMGLVTPLETFYDWIDRSQVAEVIESDGRATILLR